MLTMGNMLQIPIVKNRNVAVNEGGKEGEKELRLDSKSKLIKYI